MKRPVAESGYNLDEEDDEDNDADDDPDQDDDDDDDEDDDDSDEEEEETWQVSRSGIPVKFRRSLTSGIEPA